MSIYTSLFRPLAFRLEAEQAHHIAIKLGSKMNWTARWVRPLLAVSDPRLEVEVAGLKFPHPIGLAAGYDKSGHSVPTLASLGFGSIEIGSISIDPSNGNPKPRLWRLPEDRALLVHYGMQNDGAHAVAQRVQGLRLSVPLGINIGITNRGKDAPPLDPDSIVGEYANAARLLASHANYLMLNLSCPNTPDGRDFFLDGGNMRACIAALKPLRLKIPVFMKVSSAGGFEAVERVLAAAEGHNFIAGFMFNQVPGKPDKLKSPDALWRSLPGTVAGPPCVYREPMACTAECYRRMDKRRYVLISAGGVTTAEDAYAKICNGASLVQLFTAMIYEGPLLARRVARGLGALLERDGLRSISEAVGVDVR
jgi:dihydroorotate dehydrogenase